MIPSDSRFTVILNDRAGMGRRKRSSRSPDHLRQVFHRAGRDVRLLSIHPRHLDEVLQKLVGDGEKYILVGGGDGTANTVANALAHTDTAFGLLPFGTVNYFARSINTPMEPDKAILSLLAGKVIRIDTGEVNGRLFLNQSSIGVYPDVLAKRNYYQQAVGMRKFTAMAYAWLQVLRHLPRQRISMQFYQERRMVTTPFLFVANNRFDKGPWSLFRRNDLAGGRLHVFYTEEMMDFTAVLRMFLQLLPGHLRDVPILKNFMVETLNIQGRRRHIRVAMDGEIRQMRFPLQYRINPNSLNLILPRQYDTDTLEEMKR
jgi:diacylglycerol kinase family enzyme